MTPYKAAQVVNIVLASLNIEREIRPQMIYNYCIKGYIKAQKINEKWDVDESDLLEWFKKYVKKNFDVEFETENKVDENKIEGQEELDLESAMA